MKKSAPAVLLTAGPWKLEGDFAIPCIFTCSRVVRRDDALLTGYGAADAKIGLVEAKLDELTMYLKHFAGSCLVAFGKPERAPKTKGD